MNTEIELERRKRIVTCYDSGDSIRAIAESEGLTRAAVRRELISAGVLLRWHGRAQRPALRRPGAPKLIHWPTVFDYLDRCNESLREVASIFGVHEDTIRKARKRVAATA